RGARRTGAGGPENPCASRSLARWERNRMFASANGACQFDFDIKVWLSCRSSLAHTRRAKTVKLIRTTEHADAQKSDPGRAGGHRDFHAARASAGRRSVEATSERTTLRHSIDASEDRC